MTPDQTNSYILASRLVNTLFKDKVDKGGHAYVGHLYTVSKRAERDCKDINTRYNRMMIGLLHDIIEDTHITAEDLLFRYNFDEYIVSCVELLTKPKNISYVDYIGRILNSNNLDVIAVKLSDLEDNINITRLKSPTENDMSRLQIRYIPAWIKLKQKQEELLTNNLKGEK